MLFSYVISIRVLERITHISVGFLMLCTEISLAFFPPIGIVLYYKTSLIGIYTSIGTLNSLNKVIQTLILSVDNNIYGTCIRCPWGN